MKSARAGGLTRDSSGLTDTHGMYCLAFVVALAYNYRVLDEVSIAGEVGVHYPEDFRYECDGAGYQRRAVKG